MSRKVMQCIDGSEVLNYGIKYYIENEHTLDEMVFVDVYASSDSKEKLGTFRLDRFEEVEKEPNVLIIEITSCMDCPEVDVQRDPDPHDSFCSDDMKCICKLTGKIITCACRPYNLRKETSIPDDCPKLREMD